MSLLAGVRCCLPAVVDRAPGTRHGKDVIAAKVLPDGALNLLCGGAGDLLDALGSDDVIAFTGSADTARRVRGHANVVARSVPVNIEADSINAALLAPGSSAASVAFDAFVREVVREMTVKAGQKCTAIRRIFVAADRPTRSPKRLRQSSSHQAGHPRQDDTRMGPVVTHGQQAAAFEGIRRLAAEAAIVCGGADAPELQGIDKDRSAFVAPTLLKVADAGAAGAVHEVEVFGPAATVVPYRDEQDAAGLIARGGGSLVASVYGEDLTFLARMVSAIGPSHGRLLMVDPSVASAHTGHGIVMPQCNHGGPGRAGAGEELGRSVWSALHQLGGQGSGDLLACRSSSRKPALKDAGLERRK